MTTEEHLQKAKELIQAKKYSEARYILRYIDHPTAKKWLAKLDSFKETGEHRAIPAPPPVQRPIPLAPVVPVKAGSKTRGCLIFAVTIIAIGVAAILIIRESNYNQRYQAIRPQAYADMRLFCDFGTYLGDVRCEEYARNTTEDNRQWAFDAVFCGEIYNPITDVEGFGTCLVRNDVPLP